MAHTGVAAVAMLRSLPLSVTPAAPTTAQARRGRKADQSGTSMSRHKSHSPLLKGHAGHHARHITMDQVVRDIASLPNKHIGMSPKNTGYPAYPLHTPAPECVEPWNPGGQHHMEFPVHSPDQVVQLALYELRLVPVPLSQSVAAAAADSPTADEKELFASVERRGPRRRRNSEAAEDTGPNAPFDAGTHIDAKGRRRSGSGSGATVASGSEPSKPLVGYRVLPVCIGSSNFTADQLISDDNGSVAGVEYRDLLLDSLQAPGEIDGPFLRVKTSYEQAEAGPARASSRRNSTAMEGNTASQHRKETSGDVHSVNDQSHSPAMVPYLQWPSAPQLLRKGREWTAWEDALQDEADAYRLTTADVTISSVHLLLWTSVNSHFASIHVPKPVTVSFSSAITPIFLSKLLVQLPRVEMALLSSAGPLSLVSSLLGMPLKATKQQQCDLTWLDDAWSRFVEGRGVENGGYDGDEFREDDFQDLDMQEEGSVGSSVSGTADAHRDRTLPRDAMVWVELARFVVDRGIDIRRLPTMAVNDAHDRTRRCREQQKWLKSMDAYRLQQATQHTATCAYPLTAPAALEAQLSISNVMAALRQYDEELQRETAATEASELPKGQAAHVLYLQRLKVEEEAVAQLFGDARQSWIAMNEHLLEMKQMVDMMESSSGSTTSGSDVEVVSSDGSDIMEDVTRPSAERGAGGHGSSSTKEADKDARVAEMFGGGQSGAEDSPNSPKSQSQSQRTVVTHDSFEDFGDSDDNEFFSMSGDSDASFKSGMEGQDWVFKAGSEGSWGTDQKTLATQDTSDTASEVTPAIDEGELSDASVRTPVTQPSTATHRTTTERGAAAAPARGNDEPSSRDRDSSEHSAMDSGSGIPYDTQGMAWSLGLLKTLPLRCVVYSPPEMRRGSHRARDSDHLIGKYPDMRWTGSNDSDLGFGLGSSSWPIAIPLSVVESSGSAGPPGWHSEAQTKEGGNGGGEGGAAAAPAPVGIPMHRAMDSLWCGKALDGEEAEAHATDSSTLAHFLNAPEEVKVSVDADDCTSIIANGRMRVCVTPASLEVVGMMVEETSRSIATVAASLDTLFSLYSSTAKREVQSVLPSIVQIRSHQRREQQPLAPSELPITSRINLWPSPPILQESNRTTTLRLLVPTVEFVCLAAVPANLASLAASPPPSSDSASKRRRSSASTHSGAGVPGAADPNGPFAFPAWRDPEVREALGLWPSIESRAAIVSLSTTIMGIDALVRQRASTEATAVAKRHVHLLPRMLQVGHARPALNPGLPPPPLVGRGLLASIRGDFKFVGAITLPQQDNSISRRLDYLSPPLMRTKPHVPFAHRRTPSGNRFAATPNGIPPRSGAFSPQPPYEAPTPLPRAVPQRTLQGLGLLCPLTTILTFGVQASRLYISAAEPDVNSEDTPMAHARATTGSVKELSLGNIWATSDSNAIPLVFGFGSSLFDSASFMKAFIQLKTNRQKKPMQAMTSILLRGAVRWAAALKAAEAADTANSGKGWFPVRCAQPKRHAAVADLMAPPNLEQLLYRRDTAEEAPQQSGKGSRHAEQRMRVVEDIEGTIGGASVERARSPLHTLWDRSSTPVPDRYGTGARAAARVGAELAIEGPRRKPRLSSATFVSRSTMPFPDPNGIVRRPESGRMSMLSGTGASVARNAKHVSHIPTVPVGVPVGNKTDSGGKGAGGAGVGAGAGVGRGSGGVGHSRDSSGNLAEVGALLSSSGGNTPATYDALYQSIDDASNALASHPYLTWTREEFLHIAYTTSLHAHHSLAAAEAAVLGAPEVPSAYSIRSVLDEASFWEVYDEVPAARVFLWRIASLAVAAGLTCRPYPGNTHKPARPGVEGKPGSDGQARGRRPSLDMPLGSATGVFPPHPWEASAHAIGSSSTHLHNTVPQLWRLQLAGIRLTLLSNRLFTAVAKGLPKTPSGVAGEVSIGAIHVALVARRVVDANQQTAESKLKPKRLMELVANVKHVDVGVSPLISTFVGESLVSSMALRCGRGPVPS